MKTYLLPALALCLAACNMAQKPNDNRDAGKTTEHQLIKKWETDSLLKTPESVLFDKSAKVLYVSNIDGKEPWVADGKGSIGKISPEGKILNAEWVKGLDAPKGMGMFNGKLYVADLKNLRIINIADGKIEKTVAVPGAVGLNDVTIDADGVVYVSDSEGKQLFKYSNGQSELFMKDLKGPNGVLIHENTLYVLDNGGMFKVGSDKSLIKVADGMEGNTDGIENIGGKDFIVSCWMGSIWYINGDGTKQLLLDTRKEGKNTADIGININTRTIYVPTFFKNTVVAYEVK